VNLGFPSAIFGGTEHPKIKGWYFSSCVARVCVVMVVLDHIIMITTSSSSFFSLSFLFFDFRLPQPTTALLVGDN
jgi:hypothetical protein